MSSQKTDKRVLVLSWNAVPSRRGGRVISATGMRCHKLALGLLENGVKKVDVAVKNLADEAEEDTWGYGVQPWLDDKQIIALANKYHSVILNANYGESATTIMKGLSPEVVKVVDAFIPYYFEDIFINEKNKDAESFHTRSLEQLHYTLSRADHILVANQSQKLMYLGALGATNLLNYSNFSLYEDDILIAAPGIIGEPIPHLNPYEKFEEKIGKRKIVVWFGSTYGWYNIQPLLEAYRTNKKLQTETILFVIGAENPNFGHTTLPDVKNFNESDVVFVPWVDYRERLAWLAHADIGVNINHLSPENLFSFRNRLLDYVEAGLPLLTNGQDPLGELLIDHGGAFRITGGGLAQHILRCIDDSEMHSLRQGIKRLRDTLANDRNHKELAAIIMEHGSRPLNKDFLVYTAKEMEKVIKAKEKAISQYDDQLQDMAASLQSLQDENARLGSEVRRLYDMYATQPKTVRAHIKHSIKYRMRHGKK